MISLPVIAGVLAVTITAPILRPPQPTGEADGSWPAVQVPLADPPTPGALDPTESAVLAELLRREGAEGQPCRDAQQPRPDRRRRHLVAELLRDERSRATAAIAIASTPRTTPASMNGKRDSD